MGQPASGLTFLKSLKIHVAEKHTSKNVRGYSEVQLFTCMHYFYMYVSTAQSYFLKFLFVAVFILPISSYV